MRLLPLLLPGAAAAANESSFASASAAAAANDEPIAYVGPNDVDFSVPDGGLRPAVGVQNYQVLRAFRDAPAASDGFGWTYHHSPMMQYYNGTLYVTCNSEPVDEDTGEGHVLLMASADEGVTWTFPKLLFETLLVTENGTAQPTINNHRIGFWTSPATRRLYAMTAYYPSLYGNAPDGDDIHRKWLGYALREVRSPTEFGPAYFVADNPSLYERAALPLPYYTAAAPSDAALVADCELLRADKLATLSWWEALLPESFSFPTDLVDFIGVHGGRDFGKAAAWYTRPDGSVVCVWKESWCAVSADGRGVRWTAPTQLTTMGAKLSKVWAQRTQDGRYACSWTPQNSAAGRDGEGPRYPLQVATGPNGTIFDEEMLSVNAEVYRRYWGHNKNYGPSNYQRGLLEGNSDAIPDMWMACT
jgi:hypothetical protein